MSGHSKWETIKRAKSANDAKRGALFTKLGNAIAIAARNGTDPDMNFSLRLAIDKAKAANMPTANIERAIARVSDKNLAQLEEVMYEGYGPGGVAILVECATDNTNRTYPFVKTAFGKHGGSIADKGSVAYQFERVGLIRIKGSDEDLLLKILDAGASDVAEDGEQMFIYVEPKMFADVRDNLKAQNINIDDAELTYRPKNVVKITDEITQSKILRLMEALEELDDVTNTYVNFELTD